MGLMTESLQDEQFTIKNDTVAEKWLHPPREIQSVRIMGSKSGSEPYMTICEIVIFRQTGYVHESVLSTECIHRLNLNV